MKSFPFILLFFTAFMHVSTSLYGQEIINFRMLKNKPIIQANLNGKRGYFLLDTGSDITMLHSKAYEKYAFQYYLSNKRHLLNSLSSGNLVLYETYDVQLKIGEHPIVANFFAFDLTQVIETIYSISSVKICGIIGADTMQRHKFVIDYGNKQVVINNVNQE